jgi:hypothetical protein
MLRQRDRRGCKQPSTSSRRRVRPCGCTSRALAEASRRRQKRDHFWLTVKSSGVSFRSQNWDRLRAHFASATRAQNIFSHAFPLAGVCSVAAVQPRAVAHPTREGASAAEPGRDVGGSASWRPERQCHCNVSQKHPHADQVHVMNASCVSFANCQSRNQQAPCM